jgi:hypothetical protein
MDYARFCRMMQQACAEEADAALTAAVESNQPAIGADVMIRMAGAYKRVADRLEEEDHG